MIIAHYLKDLGVANFEFIVEDVRHSIIQDTSVAKKINTHILIVEQHSQFSFCKNGNTKDLLNKMLLAIGVDINSTTCISDDSITHVLNTYNAEIIILAGNFEHYNSDYFVIPHPQQILKNPNLKRDAWEVLKKIKKHL